MDILNRTIPCVHPVDEELIEDQSLRATGTVVEVDHPERWQVLSVGKSDQMSDSPTEVTRSPCWRTYRRVLRQVLGFTDHQVRRIHDSGALDPRGRSPPSRLSDIALKAAGDSGGLLYLNADCPICAALQKTIWLAMPNKGVVLASGILDCSQIMIGGSLRLEKETNHVKDGFHRLAPSATLFGRLMSPSTPADEQAPACST